MQPFKGVRSRCAAGLVVAGVFALGACSGDDEEGGGSGGGGDDFKASADAICIDSARAGIAAVDKAGDLENAQDAARLAAAESKVYEDQVAELEALEAPSESSEQFAAYVTKLRAVKAGYDLQFEAAEKDDQADYSVNVDATEQLAQEADDAAAAIGLDACSEHLPADAEEEVRAVVERTGTTDDPAQCTEDYTMRFVENQFGDVSQCEAAQEDSEENSADSVEIDEIRGFEEVAARTTVTPTGGPADGQMLAVQLRYEDGRWKIDVLQPVGPQQ